MIWVLFAAYLIVGWLTVRILNRYDGPRPADARSQTGLYVFVNLCWPVVLFFLVVSLVIDGLYWLLERENGKIRRLIKAFYGEKTI